MAILPLNWISFSTEMLNWASIFGLLLISFSPVDISRRGNVFSGNGISPLSLLVLQDIIKNEIAIKQTGEFFLMILIISNWLNYLYAKYIVETI